jgi:hypothetical protein
LVLNEGGPRETHTSKKETNNNKTTTTTIKKITTTAFGSPFHHLLGHKDEIFGDSYMLTK